jgi:2-polyprenyl-3-methyl-5-hydroxy-6-metoxy-1,4-benzoquinol methylase
MNDNQDHWTESDSKLYQEIAAVAVPARAEQIATMLALLPVSRDTVFQAAELGCGQGVLSQALLACFPGATVLALDGSADMRAAATGRLAKFGDRARIRHFELSAAEWRADLHNVDCVLSSLVIHHLPDEGKKNLYADIHSQISARGALLVADLVKPQRSEAQALYAAAWDHVTQAQSLTSTKSTALFERFETVGWNCFRYEDSLDRPAPLSEQLVWLKDAGFEAVDCFWLQAGHAVYGGYKTGSAGIPNGIPYTEALRLAETILEDD